VRITDTLSLAELQVSEAYEPEARQRPDLEILGQPEPMTFDAQGNLPPFGIR
jgi:hypothetical protein